MDLDRQVHDAVENRLRVDRRERFLGIPVGDLGHVRSVLRVGLVDRHAAHREGRHDRRHERGADQQTFQKGALGRIDPLEHLVDVLGLLAFFARHVQSSGFQN